MEWKPILSYKWSAWASSTIENVARVLTCQDLSTRFQGLLYGNSGIIILLFYIADRKNDDDLFQQATELLRQPIKQLTTEMEHISRYAEKILKESCQVQE